MEGVRASVGAVAYERLWVTGGDELQDEIREALDKGLATGKEVGASLEVRLNIGNDADVFDEGGGGKARR